MASKRMKKSVDNLLSVRELKTWLDGYCAAQDATWSPTAEQWKIIKTKIFNLEEGAQAPQAAPETPQAPYQQTQYAVQRPPQSAMDNLENTVVGASNSPTMIYNDGKLKTPDKMDPNAPSSFA